MTLPPFPSASLYVGNLSGEVSEAHLFEKFNTIGAVASIRVCRDAVTRRSLGYAYVNYHNTQDAEEAMETFSNTSINGKLCRIMWSQRDPSVRKSGVGNIFIKNLHKSIDHKELFDTFYDFGTILSCKIATDEEGKSKGYAFVHFETQEQADRSIATVNKMLLKNQEVLVGRFVPKKERVKSREQKGCTNLFVKNFDDSLDDESLKKMFSNFGTINSCVVMKDSNSKSKGFGFVNFENPEHAKLACEELNGKLINGKPLFVSRAQLRAERQAELNSKFKTEMANKYQGVNLYVKNLSDDIDDQKLSLEFSQFGGITSAEVMKDDKGNSKGFGFVCFTTPEEAQRACSEMNSKIFGTKPIYVALAQRKDARRAQLVANRLKGSPFTGMPMNGNLYPGGPPVYYGSQGGNIPPTMYTLLPPQQQQRQHGKWNVQQFPFNNAFINANNNSRSRNNNSRGPQNRRGGSYRGGPRDNVQPPVQSAPQEIKQDSAPEPNPIPEILTLEFLEQCTIEQRTAYLGEKLYPMIAKVQPDLAGKITGMLLGLPLADILVVLRDPNALCDQVNEAVHVLETHVGQGNAE